MTVALARPEATLESRYTASEGWVYMTGTQALVRLPIQQRLRDAAAGLNTGGYISGYRGSPLGRYDIELWRAAAQLKQHNIVFRPGLNEDLAATAIWGAQQLNNFPGATVDGVFGIWYGKGPGVDRSADALRHANFTGASPKGGVLALAGDDHGAKSSTAVNFSDTLFIAVGMPVLYPSNTQELLDFGLHGIAMSRFSGCWVGMKVVTDVAEGGGTVYVGPDLPEIVLPQRSAVPPGGLWARALDAPVAQEERLYQHKLPAALAYARANSLNRIIDDPEGARIGVVAAGKAWQDLLQALGNLGGDDGAALGLRLLKVGMVWPLDPVVVRDFARGLDLIVVIEEKAPTPRRSDSLHPLWRSEGAENRRQIFRRARLRRFARLSGHSQLRRDHARTRRRRSGQSGLGTRSELRLKRAGGARRCAQQSSSADAQSGLLRGVSAQPFDPRARGQPSAGRHRLPLDGDAGQPATDRDRFAYGRRRRDVARTRAVHQRGTRIRQHRRRHLRPFRVARDPSGDRRRRADHLQDPVQRLRLDDRRTADRGRHDADANPRGTGGGRREETGAGGRRSRSLCRRPVAPQCHASPPRRDGRDAARISRIQGRLGHPLRPALRDRAAAPAQARQMGRSGHPHIYQSRRLRRLRRLRARLQLHGDRTARDGIRAQAAHQSVELQQGLLLRRGILPELRDRSWRTPAQARGDRALEPVPAASP